MATPSMPAVQASPTPTEIDPVSQANADEAARQAKARQQKGVSAEKTILTSGLDTEAKKKTILTSELDTEVNKKKTILGA